METAKLKDMKGGWFVGNFEPSLYKTNDVEAAVQNYKAGDYEAEHYHRIATEITVIVSGAVEMNKVKYEAGDMIVMEPNESTDLYAITDTVAVVLKIPGANNDKYTGKADG